MATSARRRLEVAANGDRVLLAVEDDGQGIPAADRERVFERFGRLDDARSSGDGVGLGLAVVRRIVERHVGTVRVVDMRDGRERRDRALDTTIGNARQASPAATEPALTQAPQRTEAGW